MGPTSTQSRMPSICIPRRAAGGLPRTERGGPVSSPKLTGQCIQRLGHPWTTRGRLAIGAVLVYKCTSPPLRFRSGSPAIRGRLEGRTLAIRRLRVIRRRPLRAIRRRLLGQRVDDLAIRRRPWGHPQTTLGHPQTTRLLFMATPGVPSCMATTRSSCDWSASVSKQRLETTVSACATWRTSAVPEPSEVYVTDLVVRSIRTDASGWDDSAHFFCTPLNSNKVSCAK